jgi:hypothetical protein
MVLDYRTEREVPVVAGRLQFFQFVIALRRVEEAFEPVVRIQFAIDKQR